LRRCQLQEAERHCFNQGVILYGTIQYNNQEVMVVLAKRCTGLIFVLTLTMKKQGYNNYKKYYAPHHFIFLPVMMALIVTGTCKAFKNEAHQLEWALFSIACFAILYLGIMVRQHYALGNQDRIVRLEFRLRYFELYGEPSKKVEPKISFGQLAALRFASDDEFITLLNRVLEENISSDDIKKLIKDWQADDMRV